MPLDEYRRANRANWNDRASIHYASEMYDTQGFIQNPEMISREVQFDRGELGSVVDKTLLHLQCHIGTDTLSWARLGADVTGVDLSDKSIDAARKLSRDSGTPGRFEVAELYDSPNVIEDKFDIVYTGIGAIAWLPDINAWASTISDFLKPGGVFYIREFHPMAFALENASEDGPLTLGFPYFGTDKPLKFDEEHTYTDGGTVNATTVYEWSHGLGEIVTALISAGIRIEFLHEQQFSEFQMYPTLRRDDDGRWRLPDHRERLPLMFSIKGRKESA